MATVGTVGPKGARSKGYPSQRGGLSKRPGVLAFLLPAAPIITTPTGPKVLPPVPIGVPGKIGVPGALGGLSPAAKLALRGLGTLALPLAMYQDYMVYQGRIAAVAGSLPWLNDNWTLDRDCSRTPAIYRYNTVVGPCNFAVAVTAGTQGSWPPAAVPGTVTQLAALTAVQAGPPTHRLWAQHYTRALPAPDPAWELTGAQPEVQLKTLPLQKFVPGFLEIIDPMSVPVEAPMPYPATLPVRGVRVGPNPQRAPGEQSVAGNRPPLRSPEGVASGGLPPTVTIGGDAPPRFSPPRFRPRRRDKSRKLLPTSKGGKAAMGIASGLLNVVTETKDVVDILYDALPSSIKRGFKKNPPLHTKIIVVLSNLDEVDYDEAIPNLIINEVEDRLVGFKEGLKVKAAKKAGLSRGYSFKGAENPFTVNVPNVRS